MSGPAGGRDLTDKQRAFVAEYLLDLNGAAAARRAGYSAKTASEQAAQMLRMPKVLAAVQAGQQARAKRTELTADWVLAELRGVVEQPSASAGARVKALELLGRHVGMWVPRSPLQELLDALPVGLREPFRELIARYAAEARQAEASAEAAEARATEAQARARIAGAAGPAVG